MNELFEDELAMEMEGFDFEDDFELMEDMELEAGSDWEGDYIDMESDMEDSIIEMEMLAEDALEAESEEEADEIFGMLASALLPKAISLGKRFLPKIARGLTSFFGKKRHSAIGKKMIRIAPQVIRNVARGAARRYGNGMPITPSWLLNNVANQTYRAVRNPNVSRRALRNHYRFVRQGRARPRHTWGAGAYGRSYPGYARRRMSRYYGMPAAVH